MNSDKTILYICYTDIDNKKLLSGSSVRPAKILEAFKQLGYNVIALIGEQVKKDRIYNIKKVKKIIDKTKIDFCYIESPTYPIIRHSDRALIKYINKKGIPIGYFYRDFYRKFPELFPKRKNFTGFIKEKGLDFLQFLTDRVLNFCDIIYLPSKECKYLFNYKNMIALPPGGDNHLNKKTFNYTGIYVGGLSEGYGIDLLFNVFEMLYSINRKYKLILVCRKQEWDEVDSKYKSVPWLEVLHLSSSELSSVYDRASFALSCKKKTRYNEFAISVKVFEYLSYGLPQLNVDSTAIKSFIDEEKIGFALDENPKLFVDAIERMRKDPKLYGEICSNIENALLKRHLWVNRAEKISRDLEKF